jgi:hypothetical protein
MSRCWLKSRRAHCVSHAAFPGGGCGTRPRNAPVHGMQSLNGAFRSTSRTEGCTTAYRNDNQARGDANSRHEKPCQDKPKDREPPHAAQPMAGALPSPPLTRYIPCSTSQAAVGPLQTHAPRATTSSPCCSRRHGPASGMRSRSVRARAHERSVREFPSPLDTKPRQPPCLPCLSHASPPPTS